jgi:cobalt-zinc-cadmium efflux system membrane fusion protein
MIALVLLMVVLFSFGGEKHEHEHKHEHTDSDHITLTDEAIKELGIELYVVRNRPAGKVIRIPAEVHENPLLSFSVHSPVQGIVRRLYVKEGDFVRKGQPVAEIYSPELAGLIGELEMAKVRMESARKIYERDKSLYEERVIQYTRFYDSMIRFERERGEYEALKERVDSYGEVRGYHLILKSPGTGYVVEQGVILGDSVSPDRVLFKIHSHEVLWVYGWAGEDEARELREGSKASVVTAGGGLSCTIDYIAHEVDRKTRRTKVRCIAKNRDHLLKPGMFVKLELSVGRETALLIPKKAVQEIEGERVVFVRTEEGFEARRIHILREIDGYYVVSEGLKEGERIAVSGTVFLKTKLVGVEEGGHAH